MNQKRICFYSTFFIDIYKIFKIKIWWMILGILLKLFFVWIFHLKKCVQFSLTSFATFKYNFVIKTIEIFHFLPLINIPVTTGFSFLLLIISPIISSKSKILTFFYTFVFFNTFINILQIIWIFNKRSRVVIMI